MIKNEYTMYTNTFLDRLKTGEISIQFNGHFKQGIELTTYDKTEFCNKKYHFSDSLFYDKLKMMSLELIDGFTDMFDKWKNGEITKPFTLGYTRCGECGEIIYQSFDGKTLTFIQQNKPFNFQCKHIGGISDYTVSIDVPSGILVFANDFRQFMEYEPDYGINHNYGIKQVIEDTAKQNFLTCFVGNTCPGVYLNDQDEIIVGNQGWEQEGPFYDEYVVYFGEHKGSICTDLWWFYAMDKNHYDRLNGNIEKTHRGRTHVIDIDVEAQVELTPGRYQMTVFTNPYIDEDRYVEKFASIKRTDNIKLND